MSKMLKEEIEIYSEKYNIHGVVRDYGAVTKLSFSYEGKDIEMAIHRNILLGERLGDVGRDTMESYITNLTSHESGRKLQVHYWYIEDLEEDGKTYRIGHGIVTGHKYLEDANYIHTSAVRAIQVDEQEGEVVMTTNNSVYHCPLAYCSFGKQDKYPNIIPRYKQLKKKYRDAVEYPSIEAGKVLLVLANFCDYYFHSLYYIPVDAKKQEPLKFRGYPHVGTFQDSFLISVEGDRSIDIRYFPHYQNIEFYDESTAGLPFYVENIGDVVLYVKTHAGTIKLEPGDRKEVVKENAEQDVPILPGGDLYPAGIIE